MGAAQSLVNGVRPLEEQEINVAEDRGPYAELTR